MANFYTDNPEIKFYLSHPLLKHIVELKERNFADADKYDYAPDNLEDAFDSYDRVLELAGDVMANVVAPNAEDVDAEGPHLENNRMIYASKTYENLDATIKAGLNGVTMPRRYGGLNFPMAVYSAINEMVATADTGFENIWSLQDCIATLYEFGDEEHKVSGMLLYAKTEEEIQPNNTYQMHGNQITVRTLDLNLPFAKIAEQLNEIAESHFDLKR